MVTIIHINGPINSGKSTVGAALAKRLPHAVFIDGDDHDAPDEAPLPVRIAVALDRIESRIAEADGDWLVVAYPLDEASYDRLKRASDKRGARFLVLTLAPPLDVALSDRGTRTLSPMERERIAVMYEEGYHARPFSDLVLDTADLKPQEAAERAAAMIRAAGL